MFKQKKPYWFKKYLHLLFSKPLLSSIFKHYHLFLLGIVFLVFHIFYEVPFTISFFTIAEMFYAFYTFLLGSFNTTCIQQNYYSKILSTKKIKNIVNVLCRIPSIEILRDSEEMSAAIIKNIFDSDFSRKMRIRLDILFFTLFIYGYYYQLKPYNKETIFYSLYFVPIITSYYYFKFLKSLFVVFVSNFLYCLALFASKTPLTELESIFFSRLFIFVFILFVLEYYRKQYFLPRAESSENKIKLHEKFTKVLSELANESFLSLRKSFHLLNELSNVLKCDIVALFLIEDDKLILRSAKGYSHELVNNAFYEKGEGLTGFIWEENRTIMLDNILNNPRRASKYYDKICALQVASSIRFLGVPIKKGNETIGVITLIRVEKKPGSHISPFSEDDASFVETISLQIALSYENEKNKVLIQQIYDISKKINSLTDYGKILEGIVKAPSEFMDVYLCAIFIREGDHLVIRKVWCQSEEHKKNFEAIDRILISDSIIYKSLIRKTKEVIKDLDSSELHYSRKELVRIMGLKSLLAIPLIQGEEEIGILNIFTNKIHEFSLSEKESAEIFANQLIHAIQYNEGKLKALNNILKVTQLINSPTKPEKIYDAILESAFNLTGANVGAIILIDQFISETSCVYQKGFGNQIESVSEELRLLSCPAIKQNKTIFEHKDAKKGCMKCSFPEIHKLIKRYCIPIRSNNEIIGNLFLGCMEEHKTVNLAIPFFDIFTEQIGIVINKTQTFSEVVILNELSREILSEPAHIYEKTLKTLRKKIKDRNCALFVKCPDGFRMEASDGYPEKLKGQVYKEGEGLTGSVVKERKTIIVNNIQEDPRWSGRNQGILPSLETSTAISFIGTPMFDRFNNVIGIITLTKEKFSKDLNVPGFINKHKQFLEAFASIASIVIENVSFAQHRNEAERKSRESLELFVRGTAHELQNPFLNMELYIRFLLNKTPKDDECYSMLKAIDESIKQSQAVVKNLRSFAKLDKIITAPHRISIVVSELVQRNKKLYEGKNIYCNTNFQIEDDICLIDVAFFKQVVTNVLKNAEDAVPINNGTIDISTFKDKEYIGLKIEDNGPGFSKESFDLIFNLHYSTKKKGSGIGLPLSRSIIEKMGGSIKVGNNKDWGAVVTIFLPQAKSNTV